jgi:predicted ATP-grasp superfamily ATP-dependent carboligase
LSLSTNFPADSTIVIAAFGGWNDAAASATDVIDHLIEVWNGTEYFDVQRDDFYDYTYNRPEVSTNLEGIREIEWPGTKIYKAKTESLPTTQIFLVQGDEPSMRWENFSNSILDQVGNNPSTILITLGAMLAEVPHTRPVPVNGATINKELQDLTGYTMSNYEGPTGILSVLASQAERRGVAAASIWAALPHYVGAPPCPKATLALIRGLEDILNISIPVLELVEDARAWQTGVEELAIEDEEVAEYIRSLEESQDTAELPEASGEAIAREFERYLRRREN